MDTFTVVAAVLLLFLLLYLGARREVVRRSVRCPRTREPADVAVLRFSQSPRRPLGIRRCSLCGGRPDCAQECLPLCW